MLLVPSGKVFHVVSVEISDVYILSCTFAHMALGFLNLKTQIFDAR